MQEPTKNGSDYIGTLPLLKRLSNNEPAGSMMSATFWKRQWDISYFFPFYCWLPEWVAFFITC
jgi:hypothetical protein